MSDEKPARESNAEDARIDALEARLEAAREREEKRNRPKVQGTDANYRAGNRALADLIGGILGGAVIGWAIDALAGTTPWGLLAFLFLGTAAAFRNIIVSANKRPEVKPDDPNEDGPDPGRGS
ncbi:MAG: AtpZ/AtpI family protein [Erythrobacter sp.]|uniref:AtpZ/AtpI family protein n=1 Tax=Erythrobacter sp. TaxID=1042 RepID=UPI0032EC26AD